VGVSITRFIIKTLLYIENMTLKSRTLWRLYDHLNALESFCMDIGMNVPMNKTKIVVF
jgi:hypothetical protein